MRSDVKAEAIHAVTRVAVAVGIQPPPSDVEDVPLYFRLQIALERVAASLIDHVHFLQFRERLDAEPALITELVLIGRRIIE